jgi:hypothetical protein
MISGYKSGAIRFSAISGDISPIRKVELGSAQTNEQPWRGIESRLEANVLVLWPMVEPTPVIIVSLDLLYPGRLVRNIVERAAAPLGPNQIIVAATHTHRAPMTDDTKPLLGKVDSDYIDFLTEKLTNMVRSAMSGIPQLATLHVGHADAFHSINRRKKSNWLRSFLLPNSKFRMAPNPEGSKDETLLSITLRANDGKPVAVVWNYACHPVGVSFGNRVSSQYPGAVRKYIRVAFGVPELPVLFLQGFSGDTRPSATGISLYSQSTIYPSIRRRKFKDMTQQTYSNWSSSLAGILLDSISSSKPHHVDEIITKRISIPASEIASGMALEPVTFSRIDLGPHLTIIAVSGELVSEYAEKVRNLWPEKQVLCVSCVDHVLGYFPSENVQLEGGYEGGDFCKSFSLTGLRPNVEKTIMESIIALL